MPQFVLLYHECPTGVPRSSHWDLMLQAEDELRTWVLEELPPEWQAVPPALSGAEPVAASQPSAGGISVEEIQPHRLAYLSKQGPLSGGRGRVTRLDRGDYEVLESTACRLRAQLFGRTIRGQVDLKRDHSNTSSWQLRAYPKTSQ